MTQRYDTYKDSGVQWLGEIPGHWGCVPFKRVATVKSNLVHPNDYLELPQISPDCIEKNSGRLLSWKTVADSNVESDNHLFYKGHIIYSKIRPLLNKVIIAPFDGLCSADMYPIETTTNTKYMQYYMLSNLFLSEVRNVTRDRVKMPKINREELGQIRIIVPPLSEQRSIVSYLDDKCGKIDEWVTKKQKEVEHLQELKQRVIADAVTRGLNPHVKMKATNIPWIKEIPEHWERNKVLRLFKQIGSGTTPSSGDASLYADEGTPWLQSGDFNNNEINSTSKFLTDKALDNYSLKLYNSGGVVIAMYGASIGKVGLLNIATTVNQACCVLSDSDHLLQKFSFYVFINEKDNLVKKSKGGTQPNISQEIIKSHYIPVPPLSEQKQIVSYLDAKTSKIDKLIANITKEIDCIKEYKQRLISDVVTGQIKVC